MKLFDAVKSFFKVGAIGFGGGTALIPLIEKEVVERKQFMTEDEFREELVLQGITPGALPLKMASGLGLRFNARATMYLAYATAFVGAVLSIILTVLLSVAGDEALRQVEFLAVGVSSFIVIVIMRFICKVPRDAVKDRFLAGALILMAFSLIFSCSGKLESLIATLSGKSVKLYIPELSVTSILILGINFVFFTKFDTARNWQTALRYIAAIAVTVLGVLCFAKSPVLDIMPLTITLYVVIALMITSVIVEDVIKARRAVKSEEREKPRIKTPLFTILLLFVPYIVFAVVAATLNIIPLKEFFAATGNSIVAVVTTFGGGTAFISVAEGVFVDGGYIGSELFWTQVVPITNALPGPLLVKMLATVWYHICYIASGSIGLGVLFSVYGAVLGITFTVVTYLAVYVVFQYLKGLSIFKRMKTAILPLIAGLLMPTILSIVVNMLSITIGTGINRWWSLLVVACMVALCVGMLKLRVKEPIAILLMAGVSAGALNAIAALV